MPEVKSKDGTSIAFDRIGDGPPVIFVLGAFNDRAAGEPLAEALKDEFTIINYDRRGRGESQDTQPYSIEREIEDIEALIEEAGGSASVFGFSSGAVLSLKAATHELPITSMVLYEPPLSAEGARIEGSDKLATQISDLVKEGKRGDAVALFQTEGVGLPEEVVAGIRQAPFFPALEAMANTLVYETEIVGDASIPSGLDSVDIPTFILAGGNSFPYMRGGAYALAEVLPNGESLVLEGQTHDLTPEVLAPVLTDFFKR